MDVMMNMTTEDVRRLRGQFTGSLGLGAFVRLMKKSLRDRIHSELDFVVGVIELFHTIDVNGDAVLDWDEFAAYMMDAGQAKADFYFEGQGRFSKQYVPLQMPPPDPKTPLRHIATRVQQMRLLVDQNAMAYFEENSDVVYVYGLQFDRNDGPRHLSTMRLHTAFQEHTVIDMVYVPTRKVLVTSSVLGRGYLSVWSVVDLYNPVMTHRLESTAAQEHLYWVPSLQCMATSAVIFPSLHSGKQSESRRESYRPNAGSDQPHTKISQLELWDLSGKVRPPAPGTIATKEVAVVQERLKGVTALAAFRSINRTFLAVGREDGVLSVVDTESGHEVGTIDAHGSGVKVLVYSMEVESLASVGFHSYADETTLHISIWRKSGSGGMLTHDATLKQHEAPVELLAFVDSNLQLISVDRTETFNVYSSVMRTPTSEPWECLQTFRCTPLPASNWQLPQTLWSMVVVPETSASDAVLITAGHRVRFYDHCEVKDREEIFYAYYCTALNVVLGATSSKLLLWRGDTGALWKTYEYALVVTEDARAAQARAMTAVCVDDRERKLIVGDDAGSVKVLNLVNGNVMKELDPHTHAIVDVSYVLYGKRVISISIDSVLHVSDENNPQGFYVPFGGPIQSVLLQSLRMLPNAPSPSAQSGDAQSKQRTESGSESPTHLRSNPAKYSIMKSTGNQALNLLAVLVTSPQGDSFIQVWNFDVSHSQGTCVAPEYGGEITCMSFFGSSADIVGGTTCGHVFLWSPVPETTSYSCVIELSRLSSPSKEIAITHVVTVCAAETGQAEEPEDVAKATKSTSPSSKDRSRIFSSKPALQDLIELEAERGMHVFASDDAGFVSQWHVRRPYQRSLVTAIRHAASLDRPTSSSSTRSSRRGVSTDEAAFQHEEMGITSDSMAALYHHARAKSRTRNYPAQPRGMDECSIEHVNNAVQARREWKAHAGTVLSLEVSTDPLAVVTSSISGQIKVWSIDGEPYGILDHFATRRAPLNHPWSFPVDMDARRQQREQEAKLLLQRPNSGWKSAFKPRVSVLQQKLSLSSRDLSYSHERRHRHGNAARPSQVGRAVRNFILAQTTNGNNQRAAPSSAFKALSQDTSSLHSVLKEIEQFQLHAEASSAQGERPDSRARKYAMVTLADVKSSVLRPRSRGRSSSVHCDVPAPQHRSSSQPKQLQSPIPSQSDVVEYLWQDATASNQETELPVKATDAVKPRRPRSRDASSDLLQYHMKLAHSWQPGSLR